MLVISGMNTTLNKESPNENSQTKVSNKIVFFVMMIGFALALSFSHWTSTEYWESIIINHDCEGGIEKSDPMITDRYREACRVMTNGDRERRLFLSHPHMHTKFVFLLTLKYHILLPEVPEYGEMRHDSVYLT